jgi:hypothetical protein
MSSTNWLLIVRFYEQKTRVENLITLYELHVGSKAKGRKTTPSADILRAAVVLLHATFEEMCRAVEKHMLPYATKEAINSVPLKGTGDRGQASKFFLGELLPFRGRTVDDLILESHKEYLSRSTYNSPDDLCAMLAKYRLDKRYFEPFLADLAELNKRRHHIVHQADSNDKKGKGQHRYKSISTASVRSWLRSMQGLYSAFSEATTERIENANKSAEPTPGHGSPSNQDQPPGAAQL